MTRRGDSGIWFDLGYWLRDAFAGKGIMTMALKAALEHASSVRDVSGIMSDIIVANKASQRIMSKVGFRFLETMSRKVSFPTLPTIQLTQTMTISTFGRGRRAALRMLRQLAQKNLLWAMKCGTDVECGVLCRPKNLPTDACSTNPAI